MQLQELFIQERRYLKNVSPATISWYEQSFRAFSQSWETKELLGQRIAELLQAGLLPISINTYLRCLRAFLRWAKDEGHIQNVYAIPKLNCEQKIIPTLNSHSVRLLLEAKPKTSGERRIHVLSALLLDTGLRIDEALGLTREDVDLDNLLVRVRGKGGKHRVVPMSLELRRRMFPWLRSHDFELVFATRTGTKPIQRNLLRDFKLLGDRTGAASGVRFSFHTLRHTFAASYLRAGGNLFYLSRILGHSSIETTQRYLQSLGIADLQAVHNRLSPLTGDNRAAPDW